MSKGSNQRPKAVDDETFKSNWESTFGVKPQGKFETYGVIHSREVGEEGLDESQRQRYRHIMAARASARNSADGGTQCAITSS